MEKMFKGIWLSQEIWEYKDLILIDKVMLAVIISLDNEYGCTVSNQYLADFFGIKKVRVSQILSKLKKLNLLKEVSFDGQKRTLKVVSKDLKKDFELLENTKNYKKTRIKTKKQESAEKEVLNWWNTQIAPIGFAKIHSFTEQRKKALKARLVSCSLNDFKQIILFNLKNQSFYQGVNARNWKADFDFCLNPNKFIKMQEWFQANKDDPTLLWSKEKRKLHDFLKS